MPWPANSVADRVAGLFRLLHGTGRRAQSSWGGEHGVAATVTAEPALSQPPRLLGRLRGDRPGTAAQQSQSLPPNRRRPSRGRSRSPSPEAVLQGRGAQGSAADGAGACFGDGCVFARFCQEQVRRHAADVGGLLEHVREEAAEFSLRLRKPVCNAELMPGCFSRIVLRSGASPALLGPGEVVLKSSNLASVRQAVQQLAVRMGTAPAPVAGALLIATDRSRDLGSEVDAECLTSSFRALAPGDSTLLVACVPFDARAWADRVATLQSRGRSAEVSARGEAESRGRTRSRGSCERRSHAPTRRVLSAGADGVLEASCRSAVPPPPRAGCDLARGPRPQEGWSPRRHGRSDVSADSETPCPSRAFSPRRSSASASDTWI
mmetsp:Transcript_39502/g.108842  ORF Transcript_39502/g.108842 Transcript_39502/m.108842 type:complete len:378 (+) Transcript_39502:249-1382(+)